MCRSPKLLFRRHINSRRSRCPPPAQIQRGYSTLSAIAEVLAAPEEPASIEGRAARLLALTTDFYTVVPHKFALDEV